MKMNCLHFWVFLGWLLTWLPSCHADFATPFVEINNRVGDVSTSHGYVMTSGSEINPRFFVMVMSDTMQPVVLWATAKQGVVKESLLGREIVIKAVVTKAGSRTTKPELEILSTKPLTHGDGEGAATDSQPKESNLAAADPKPDGQPLVRRVHKSRRAATGQAVDSETGVPVESFVIRDRLPMAPQYDGPPVFGGETRREGGFRDGRFAIPALDTYEDDNLVEEGHGECQLVADGYLPEHVVVPDDHPSGEVFVVRLRRGNQIQGRVLDHTGKPVADAGIYLSNGQRVIELSEGPHSMFQKPSVRTDEDGRFEISGGGEDSKSLFVAAPSLFVWRADVPRAGQEAAIRLPEPARLRIRYNIKGAPAEAQVRLELRTWDIPGWKGAVNVERWVALKAGKDGLLIENLPPGVYDISRIKHLRTTSSGTDAMLDRNLELTLESGKTGEYNFVRPTGAPISGEIAGLPGRDVDGVFVYVKPAEASGDPRGRTDWKLPTFDGVGLDEAGEFTTECIPPGQYKVIATANRTESPEERRSTGLRLPAWVGSATVTVPETGDPPRVRVEMKPYSPHERTVKAQP
jgi:hypothetical protein